MSDTSDTNDTNGLGRRVKELIEAIHAGSIEVAPLNRRCARHMYCGKAHYTTEEGHRIVWFIDCDDFDYIDTIEWPDGSVSGYTEIDDATRAIGYAPGDEADWNDAWRVPRCPDCLAEALP